MNSRERSTSLSDEQALFIASLDHRFINIEAAISLHAFVQRVKELDLAITTQAVNIASEHNIVELNMSGKVRLTEVWREKKRQLVHEEILEVAEAELSDLIQNSLKTN